MKNNIGLVCCVALIFAVHIPVFAQDEISWLGKTKDEVIDNFGRPNRESFSDNQMFYDLGNEWSPGFFLKDDRVDYLVTSTVFNNYYSANIQLKKYLNELKQDYGWECTKEESSYHLTKDDVNAEIFVSLVSLYDGRCNLAKSFKKKSKIDAKSISSGKNKFDVLNETNIDFLKRLDGKYDSDVKLFNNAVFTNRLKKMVGGKRYDFLVHKWQVSSPMIFKDNIFIAEGCEAHNCCYVNAIIVVYLSTNLMYAAIRENKSIKTYAEAGKMPKEIMRWIKKNDETK